MGIRSSSLVQKNQGEVENDRIGKLYCGYPLPKPLPDYSEACMLEFDGASLKLNDEAAFTYLHRLWRSCYNYHNLQMFLPYPGKTGVKTYTAEELESTGALRTSAIAAINQYNNVSKEKKLKFEKLLKTVSVEFIPYSPLLCMTFSAIDLESGSSGVYQAIVGEHGGKQTLGLLNDWIREKVLVVISLGPENLWNPPKPPVKQPPVKHRKSSSWVIV